MFVPDTKSLTETLAPKETDTFHVFGEYGDHGDAYDQIACILQMFSSAQYHRARSKTISVYERVVGGIAWILQQLVPREQAYVGRIQLDFLFHPHESLKVRLMVAQEIILRLVSLRSVHAHNFTEGSMTCPYPIQPHQLLLQDFGDISTVQNVIEWLLGILADDKKEVTKKLKASHRVSYDETRYAVKQYRNRFSTENVKPSTNVNKKTVRAIEDHFRPRRRWKYRPGEELLKWKEHATEQARIQSCLLEYGERIVFSREAQHRDTRCSQLPSNEIDDHMCSMANSAKDAEHAFQSPKTKHAESHTGDCFANMYKQAESQALLDQINRLESQKTQEVQLLSRVTEFEEEDTYELGNHQFDERTCVNDLYEKLKAAQTRRIQVEAQEKIYKNALEQLVEEKARLMREEQTQVEKQPCIRDLKKMISENDDLKHQRCRFKAKCRAETQQREASMERIRKQLSSATNEALERTYAQMANRLSDLMRCIGEKNRDIHMLQRRIDQVPCHLEVLQYEKRFSELSQEVGHYLDETRKYYAMYNTLKKKLEFLVKEITLLESISVQLDKVAASKSAQLSLLEQLNVVGLNLQQTIRKHQTSLSQRRTQVDALERRYQILQQQEHAYVAAMREFQSECIKHGDVLRDLMKQ